jgi:RNA polymerase sigma factor (sigma-70 family)
MNNDSDLLSDLYQDAMIVLYQKTKDPAFELTCSIQTYINSICRNQLLNKFKQNSRFITNGDDFDAGITDWFEDEFDQLKEERINVLERALDRLKENGEKCFEILKRFFYQKESMEDIAGAMGYTNGDNVKNQKARCQKKLKELVLDNYGSF